MSAFSRFRPAGQPILAATRRISALPASKTGLTRIVFDSVRLISIRVLPFLGFELGVIGAWSAGSPEESARY